MGINTVGGIYTVGDIWTVGDICTEGDIFTLGDIYTVGDIIYSWGHLHSRAQCTVGDISGILQDGFSGIVPFNPSQHYCTKS